MCGASATTEQKKRSPSSRRKSSQRKDRPNRKARVWKIFGISYVKCAQHVMFQFIPTFFFRPSNFSQKRNGEISFEKLGINQFPYKSDGNQNTKKANSLEINFSVFLFPWPTKQGKLYHFHFFDFISLYQTHPKGFLNRKL